MGPLKAPGIDDFPALFYQKYWHLVGREISSMVLDILNNRRDLREINQTLIALISKTKAPEDFSQFRPISLCNVIMKIVTKSIANRLKMVLPDLISESQSAFVPGRLIMDNAVIALEIFHFLKKKTKGKNDFFFFALKLDMSKAYYKMEWNLLEEFLKNMNFTGSFIELIMRYITTVSYSVLLNGKP